MVEIAMKNDFNCLNKINAFVNSGIKKPKTRYHYLDSCFFDNKRTNIKKSKCEKPLKLNFFGM